MVNIAWSSAHKHQKWQFMKDIILYYFIDESNQDFGVFSEDTRRCILILLCGLGAKITFKFLCTPVCFSFNWLLEATKVDCCKKFMFVLKAKTGQEGLLVYLVVSIVVQPYVSREVSRPPSIWTLYVPPKRLNTIHPTHYMQF